MIPLLAGKGFERILIVPLRNQCVFVRGPLCGLQNRPQQNPWASST